MTFEIGLLWPEPSLILQAAAFQPAGWLQWGCAGEPGWVQSQEQLPEGTCELVEPPLLEHQDNRKHQ